MTKLDRIEKIVTRIKRIEEVTGISFTTQKIDALIEEEMNEDGQP